MDSTGLDGGRAFLLALDFQITLKVMSEHVFPLVLW